MTFNKWLKQAKKNTKIIERIESIKYAHDTDAGGFPLAPHTKISRLLILLEKYENEQKNN